MMTKSYSELIKYKTFEERFNYLRLDGVIGETTFGYDRYLNQKFYKSQEWINFRNRIIVRDNACDLGIEEHEIRYRGGLIIHHINPITVEDILNRAPCLFDEENVITVTHSTHNAIHYGNDSVIVKAPIVRKPNDTCPWRR